MCESTFDVSLPAGARVEADVANIVESLSEVYSPGAGNTTVGGVALEMRVVVGSITTHWCS